jgi:cyclophilin family peptidyl-prolyl cis-trans isomerase
MNTRSTEHQGESMRTTLRTLCAVALVALFSGPRAFAQQDAPPSPAPPPASSAPASSAPAPAAPGEAAPATSAPKTTSSGPPRVRIDTSMGTFIVRLDPDRAPLTVENFLKYVRSGQYEGTIFHRVIDNFVAQGGGFTTDYKLKPTGPSIANEAGNGLTNRRGTIGLARAGGPHTGNSQFYLNLADNPDLNPLPSRWGYAVFGEIIDGMDVVDRIGHVPTGAAGPFKEDAPVKPVVIEKIVELQ